MVSPSDILNAKVLVVDDQEMNVSVLKRTLRGAGYLSVVSTMDPREVRDLYLKHRYDLILLDLQMPDMDGFQVMEGLKEIEAEGYLPVLVITAQPDHQLRALKAGAKDFISKPLVLSEVVMRVYNMLEVRLLHKETKMLHEQLVEQQKVSERLLLDVLPELLADRSHGQPAVAAAAPSDVAADSVQEATVLFAEVAEYAGLTVDGSPQEIAASLGEIFTDFDRIADSRGLERIKTVGNAYMAVAGLPFSAADHVERAAHMALDLLEAVKRINARSGHKLQVRIGIDTGTGVAGVIGKRTSLGDLWGDSVNSAHRTESHDVAGKVQLSESTRQRLSEPFILEERGALESKGMGPKNAWFLVGRSDGTAT